MMEDNPSFEADFDEANFDDMDEEEQTRDTGRDYDNIDTMMDDVTTLNEDDPVDQVGQGRGQGQMHHNQKAGGHTGPHPHGNGGHGYNNTNQIYPQESYSQTMLKQEKYMYERSAINDAQSVAYT